jgi:dolichol kinase
MEPRQRSLDESGGEPLEALVGRTRGLQPGRRLLHALFGLVFAGILYFHVSEGERLLAALALGALTGLAFLADLLRLRVPLFNRAFFVAFRVFASPREAEGVASSTWYVAGCALTVALFPLELAVPAILVLALADPVASYFGRRWGRRRFGKGSVVGSALFLFVSLAVLLALVPPMPAVLASLVVTWVERTPWRLDDNLTVPLTTGAVLWVLTGLPG